MLLKVRIFHEFSTNIHRIFQEVSLEEMKPVQHRRRATLDTTVNRTLSTSTHAATSNMFLRWRKVWLCTNMYSFRWHKDKNVDVDDEVIVVHDMSGMFFVQFFVRKCRQKSDLYRNNGYDRGIFREYSQNFPVIHKIFGIRVEISIWYNFSRFPARITTPPSPLLVRPSTTVSVQFFRCR